MGGNTFTFRYKGLLLTSYHYYLHVYKVEIKMTNVWCQKWYIQTEISTKINFQAMCF